MSTVTIYEWPDGQLCLECQYGGLVTWKCQDENATFRYVCDIECSGNRDGRCSKFKEK